MDSLIDRYKYRDLVSDTFTSLFTIIRESGSFGRVEIDSIVATAERLKISDIVTNYDIHEKNYETNCLKMTVYFFGGQLNIDIPGMK